MRRTTFTTALLFTLAMSADHAQSGPGTGAARTFDTYTPGPCSPNGEPHGGCARGTRVRIRVAPVATGLVHPWHIAFLPDGSMLVTELPGRLRIVRNGALDPEPVKGWPVASLQSKSLNSVLPHPQFAQNHLIYLTYTRSRVPGDSAPTTVALARGRLDGSTLVDLREIFVAEAWQTGGAPAGRAAFGPDGLIYLAVGDRDNHVMSDDNSSRMSAQSLSSDAGKVLRLRDDGTIPPGNPFVGRADARPEIYTYGHRNVYGFAWHPETGALWACEIGPMGGDELNILVAGHNYGWPLVTLGKIYTGNLSSEQSWYRPGMDMPVMFWVPAISPSSLIFYTGDRFPLWKGNLFVGALSGQQLQRIGFNQPPPQAERRESLLTQLDLRIRDVRQGPDGLIYIATEKATEPEGNVVSPGSDEPTGSILRIEPVE